MLIIGHEQRRVQVFRDRDLDCPTCVVGVFFIEDYRRRQDKGTNQRRSSVASLIVRRFNLKLRVKKIKI